MRSFSRLLNVPPPTDMPKVVRYIGQQFQQVEKSVTFTLRTVTVDTEVRDTDLVILVDATAGAIEVLLPVAASRLGAFPVTVKKIDASAHVVTLTTRMGDIDGGASALMNFQGNGYSVVSDGVDYYIVGSV